MYYLQNKRLRLFRHFLNKFSSYDPGYNSTKCYNPGTGPIGYRVPGFSSTSAVFTANLGGVSYKVIPEKNKLPHSSLIAISLKIQ